jgi:hypothetical protein
VSPRFVATFDSYPAIRGFRGYDGGYGDMSGNARERTIMEISVIELVLRHAVQRGVLDADDVNEAVDRLWGARATFLEATKIPQTRPQQKESKMAEALEEFNEVSADVVSLLNSAANSG